MTRMKAVMMNPFLLGAQGFMVGVFLFWAGAFPQIGEIWGKLALPTLIVQEGGYSLKASGEAAPAFIGAFREAVGA